MRIEKEIFKQPSGQVRGSIIMFIPVGKRERRIAHALLLVDAPTDITLDLPKGKLSHQAVAEFSKALAAFSLEVAKHD